MGTDYTPVNVGNITTDVGDDGACVHDIVANI